MDREIVGMRDVIWYPGRASNENHSQGTKYRRMCDSKPLETLGLFFVSIPSTTALWLSSPQISLAWYASRNVLRDASSDHDTIVISPSPHSAVSGTTHT